MAGELIAFIGGGHMGRALVSGLRARGTPATDIAVADADAATRAALQADFGVRTSADNAAVVAHAAVLVIAVKPQVMRAVLAPLAPVLAAARPLVLSIAAGVRVARISAWCGASSPVVRAMPNRPALCGAGITGLFAPPGTSDTVRRRAEAVMAAVGETVWVDSEDHIDVVTAISGSGPAYFFLLAAELERSAVRHGLEPAAARRLAVATLHGAGRLANAGDGDLAQLRASVTSKGGTTEAALQHLAAAQFDTIVSGAVDAAVRRGRELAEVS